MPGNGSIGGTGSCDIKVLWLTQNGAQDTNHRHKGFNDGFYHDRDTTKTPVVVTFYFPDNTEKTVTLRTGEEVRFEWAARPAIMIGSAGIKKLHDELTVTV